MTASRADPPSAAGLGGLIAELVREGFAREAEVAIAVLSRWVLGEVESGRLAPSAADGIFTALDVELTFADGESPLSEEAHELIMEGEHYHHFGDEYGPDPSEIRRLATLILHHPKR